MQKYQNKQELISEINKTYDLFIREFDDVTNSDIHTRVDSVDKTPSEMISYQIGWLNSILEWEKDELARKDVITPSHLYKWNELGKLYQSFFDAYANDDLEKLLNKLSQTKERFVNWIASLDERVLFEPDQRKWKKLNS